MGRKKLEMKRIEDKSSRSVTFSKRRAGLIKKARHLSVLCDVDVAIIVFSAHGKLYESCSGSTNRVEHVLSRYQKSCLEEEVEKSTFEGAGEDLNNTKEELYVTDMAQLEEDLHAALVQTQSRKERRLSEEKEEPETRVASEKPLF